MGAAGSETPRADRSWPETGRCADMKARLEQIDGFVQATRGAIFVREADRLLLIRPDKTMAINSSAVAILSALYARGRPTAAEALHRLAPALGIGMERLLVDTSSLIEAVGALLREQYTASPVIRHGHFDRAMVRFPTLAEIALTYGCQNRCSFCYAASPDRGTGTPLMSTDEVRRVMEVIFHEAHVPSLSFTGGEATLRRDLPELVQHAGRIGFRVNLITNGLRLADEAYAASLVEAGLDSAQVSLEAGDAALHDRIVARPGAFAQTVAGVRNLQRLGIHVHTNSTLCPANAEEMVDLIRVVAHDLGLKTLSMNMVIRTGAARGSSAMEISYAEVAERLPGLCEAAQREGVRLVWYSPIPYCLFNPVLHGLGAKSCACVDGILSVDPSGEVLPCSSFATGIGSLLEGSFERLWTSRAAKYWRKKQFVPPVCTGCADVDVCAGACPLYWDAAGSFDELPRPGAADARARRRWERHRHRGRSFGVEAPHGSEPCAV